MARRIDYYDDPNGPEAQQHGALGQRCRDQ